jgi:hypothetical protein
MCNPAWPCDTCPVGLPSMCSGWVGYVQVERGEGMESSAGSAFAQASGAMQELFVVLIINSEERESPEWPQLGLGFARSIFDVMFIHAQVNYTVNATPTSPNRLEYPPSSLSIAPPVGPVGALEVLQNAPRARFFRVLPAPPPCSTLHCTRMLVT